MHLNVLIATTVIISLMLLLQLHPSVKKNELKTVNLATIAHGLEAFLAVLTLFVVHFFNNHFRPAKFPLDTVMFTGAWDLEELKEERPEEDDRLKASGELEKYLVKGPSKQWNFISHILGFALLGIGLILLIMVVDGFLSHGLF